MAICQESAVVQRGDGYDAATVDLCGSILHVRWAPETLISEALARTMIARAGELSNGQALPVLVEMSGIKGLTSGAGVLFSTEWPRNKTAIVADSPVDEVIAVFYAARHKPECPTRFFPSVAEALKWVSER